MNQDELLECLCRLCGIDLDYYDIWGNRHHAPPATQRALLTALGWPAGETADLAAVLADAEAAPWRRPLPPVQVLWPDDEPRVAITLPRSRGEHHCEWRLALEDGTRHEGACAPAALAEAGRFERGDEAWRSVWLPLPVRPAPGYHRFTLRCAGGDWDMALIAVPDAAWQPDALEGGARAWGIAAQLYALRSARNWGMGDFTDLAALAAFAADQGAAVVGVNPLHALFFHNPLHASPYSPSHRCFLNAMYLDPEAMDDFAECEAAQTRVADAGFQAHLRALRAADLVDYAAVHAMKRPLLDELYRHFRDHHLVPGTRRGRAFRAFIAEGGERLRRQALFDALQAHFHERDAQVWGWPTWPEEYRDPAGEAVRRYADEHAEQVEFHAWLQWQADRQLGAASDAARDGGLAIGLYKDLAVGADRGGAECWSQPGLYALDASVGAPPDDFNLHGQNWGLPPIVPQRLREAAYEPFIAMLRANMRHAGALRIDHVMGLMRLFWVPPGGSAENGAYVAYPFRDLLGIVLLESRRNRCMVIGEDLGTVPDEVRSALLRVGILSCRPFYFQRDHAGAFSSPEAYPRQALVSITTHDLPTLRGFWSGHDLDLRCELNLFPSEEVREQQIVARSEARARMLMALDAQGLLPAGASVHPVAYADLTPELNRAVHVYLARTPCELMVVQPEDLLQQAEQVNLPGSTEEHHPNWRRKLPLPLEAWRRDDVLRAILDGVREVRGTRNRPRRQARVPRATYRLQLTRDFTFAQATALVPYLARLGVSHCYLSPILKARPGSRHGYDIVDHEALNPELGTREEFDALCAAAHAHGMGLVLDIVPNHMAVMGSDNGWWLDVLENGEASQYARFFDIDWQPLTDELRGKVLVPVLGDHYGQVLESGALQLKFDAAPGEFSVWYFAHRFPVDPREYPLILGFDIERLAQRLGGEQPLLAEFQALAASFSHLPARHDISPEKTAERTRDKEVHKRHLARLCEMAPAIAQYLEDVVRELNGSPGVAGSFDRLHELVKRQAWRLAYWRVASDQINYRRFFDINDLAALRVEDDAVFDATHRLLFELVEQGRVDGLRVDHPDGLYDPGEYFRRLQRHFGWEDGAQALPEYLVIEKILAEHERLPAGWPVHGTTGYRFANVVNGLLVDASAQGRLSRLYADFTGRQWDFDELLYRCKKLIMRDALASELNVLSTRLCRIALASRHTCDFTVNNLRQALAEVVACLPVYRTYVTAAGVSEQDRRYIEWAVAVAKKRSPASDGSVFDFLRGVLTLDIARDRSDDYRAVVLEFAMRVQQFSAPVMAKGMEDTAFYRYNRLVSLNEVGGDPRTFGFTLNAFHGANQDRARHWPHTMVATSTHDTKRSEDVRARLDLISEMPAAWRLALRRWSRFNRSRKREVDGSPAPSANDEYLLYQTLLGAWPASPPDAAALEALRPRIEDYMLKALREAKQHTSWINRNEDYERALGEFVRALLSGQERNLFLSDLYAVMPRIVRLGLYNSLAMTLVKLTAPGVPDIYQGNEVWDFSLVDPDNRRPVDYETRRRMLGSLRALADVPPEARASAVRALLDAPEDGRPKLHVTRCALALRRRREALFRGGAYTALSAGGTRAEHVCGFAREHENGVVVTVVPRFASRLSATGTPPLGEAAWSDTWIEVPREAAYRNVLTGRALTPQRHDDRFVLPLAAVLADFPVALFEADT